MLSTVMQYVNFDIIDTESIMAKIFRFPDTGSFNPLFEKAGY